MNRGIDNGILVSDLDCNFFVIRYSAGIDSSDVVKVDDSRLYDARDAAPGSVTDASVAEDAGISQGKLDLSGDLPPNFIGHDSDHGAPGDEYQPLDQKDAAGGYASLDGDGFLPSGQIALSGTGTLKKLRLDFPEELLIDTPVLSSGSNTVNSEWRNVNQGWFGNHLASDARPGFYSGVFPEGLIPGLDASLFDTGTFSKERLPIALSASVLHNPGLVPDPGAIGEISDYLGKDMQWHHMNPVIAYQPTLDPPAISIVSFSDDGITVKISSPIGTCFYRLPVVDVFSPVTGTILVGPGLTIAAYCSEVGYNSSQAAYFTNTEL